MVVGHRHAHSRRGPSWRAMSCAGAYRRGWHGWPYRQIYRLSWADRWAWFGPRSRSRIAPRHPFAIRSRRIARALGVYAAGASRRAWSGRASEGSAYRRSAVQAACKSHLSDRSRSHPYPGHSWPGPYSGRLRPRKQVARVAGASSPAPGRCHAAKRGPRRSGLWNVSRISARQDGSRPQPVTPPHHSPARASLIAPATHARRERPLASHPSVGAHGCAPVPAGAHPAKAR